MEGREADYRPGVVHQDIYGPGAQFVGQAAPGALVGDVERAEAGRLAELVHQRPALLFPDVRYDDARSLGYELPGDGFADPARGPRDQRVLPRQTGAHAAPPVAISLTRTSGIQRHHEEFELIRTRPHIRRAALRKRQRDARPQVDGAVAYLSAPLAPQHIQRVLHPLRCQPLLATGCEPPELDRPPAAGQVTLHVDGLAVQQVQDREIFGGHRPASATGLRAGRTAVMAGGRTSTTRNSRSSSPMLAIPCLPFSGVTIRSPGPTSRRASFIRISPRPVTM